MNDEPAPPERQDQEPTWSEKVLRLNQALDERQLPYAFGGAIALNYHREPRSTLDININLFVEPSDPAAVFDALAELYGLEDRDRLQRETEEQGQTRSTWGGTYVDLFFANTDFHLSMARRVEHQPFAEATIPVLSVEDLIICKVLYDRPKDWVDIEVVMKTEPDQLDSNYVRRWVGDFLPEDEPRVKRLEELLP